MSGFLKTLLRCLVACLFIAGQAESSQPQTIIGQKVIICAKTVNGEAVAADTRLDPFGLVASSSRKAVDEVVRLTKVDNGKEITIQIGNVLQIELERFGGTGYDWYLDQSYKKYFELVKENTETRQSRGLVGTPVMKKWKLRAIQRGETDVRLLLYREWEGKDKAVETFKVRVKIL